MSDPVHLVCSRCHATNRVAAARLSDGPVCGKCKARLFGGHPIVLTGPALERHLARDDLPLLVDFWAPWCGPCRMMAPAFEAAAGELEPRVRLAKLDTEAEPAVAGRYAIRSIPTLILLRHGREVARTAGAMDARGIVDWVRSRL